jgi:hypothetical protein
MLVDRAKRWVVDAYPYNSHHLLSTLAWLERIAPDCGEAVRLAGLTHDMERAFAGPEPPLAVVLNDAAYDRAHSERSARIVGRWLRENGAGESMVHEVEQLILLHEVGGTPDADAVQAADSLSFLETNVGLFLGFVRTGRYSPEDVRRKFDRTLDRIGIPHAKALARPLWEDAVARLTAITSEREGRSA